MSRELTRKFSSPGNARRGTPSRAIIEDTIFGAGYRLSREGGLLSNLILRNEKGCEIEVLTDINQLLLLFSKTSNTFAIAMRLQTMMSYYCGGSKGLIPELRFYGLKQERPQHEEKKAR